MQAEALKLFKVLGYLPKQCVRCNRFKSREAFRTIGQNGGRGFADSCEECRAKLPARIKVRREVGFRLRFKILARDNFTCQYCGRRAPSVELHVDHKIPVSKGGSGELTNLITACVECNLGKFDTAFPNID